jgi:CDP-glucose 4,6-dehydratase
VSATWDGRRVLVTGHTGFKGAWLSLWLEALGARVTGLSLAPEGRGAFAGMAPWNDLDHREADLRDADAVQAVVEAADAEVIFHLAAQPIVGAAYRDPAETWSTNVLGTVHLLDAAEATGGVAAMVVVTTDKVYAAPDDDRPLREGDPLGGTDPYGASKAAVELLVASTRDHRPDAPPLVTARAGNVIGGGDWGIDRLVPDLFRAIEADQPVHLRNPGARRPWQFVLDPLRGYLALAEALLAGQAVAGATNLGPSGAAPTVHELVELFRADLPLDVREGAGLVHEHDQLVLDSSQARQQLDWQPLVDLPDTVRQTIEWWRTERASGDLRALALLQIGSYSKLLQAKGAPRAR